MKPQIQYAKTSDGVNIAYLVLGTGPAIVFPSTIWGNVHMYKNDLWRAGGVYDELASLGWSVITYDGRGSGASDRDVDDYTLDAKLRDLEAVVERTAPGRFVLCGSFNGGPTSIAYAAQHPQIVTNLVLSNTFANAAEYTDIEPSMRIRAALRDAEGEWEFATLTIANALTGFTDSELARSLAKAFRTGMTPRAYVAFRDAADRIDVRDLLPKIGVRTLVVHNTTARQQGIGVVTQRLARFIPDARFVQTDANDFVTVIDAFLREGGLVPTPSLVSKRRPAPSSFRAVLFTDIVGHTEMMQRLGDEKGRDVLREHGTHHARSAQGARRHRGEDDGRRLPGLVRVRHESGGMRDRPSEGVR